jgi:hypothetical protein
MSKFKFFSNCKTIQELKNHFRELVKIYHPDNRITGELQTMKALNLEYELAFEYIKTHPINDQEKKSSYYANVNDGFREVLEKIIFIPDIFIEVCGSWLWITGETKQVKDILKNAGLWYAANKKAWYFKPANYKAKKHKAWDLNKIRDTFGSETVEKQERTKVAS